MKRAVRSCREALEGLTLISRDFLSDMSGMIRPMRRLERLSLPLPTLRKDGVRDEKYA